MRVLVTGATGYIGGRLIPRLLEEGHEVRVLVRDADRIRGRAWALSVDVVEGDLLQPDSLPAALREMDAAYYLVHSMYAGAGFEEMDRTAARQFAEAAGDLQHVIYLGGLVPASASTSKHLSSRSEVGRILAEHLPVTEFRAGPIIGSGSASFEMIRYLTERLPVMVAPKWILNEVQPISIIDMLAYMTAALDRGPSGVVDVGAPPLAFEDMMRVYADLRGLKRRIRSLPVFAPRLAARWVGLITPIPNRLAVPLVEGMVQPLYADPKKSRELFPGIVPIDYRQAVQRALVAIREGRMDTRWSGAVAGYPAFELADREGLIRETRMVDVAASPESAFSVVQALGGEKGWLVFNWAWWIRGFIDRVCGGPGLRRGRRHPTELLPGEAVDFWRVEAIEAPHLLRLRAEMKVPGKAWLQFEVKPGESGTRLVQTALFAPDGFAGLFYWKGLYPLHRVIFSAMIRALRKEIESDQPAGHQ